MRWQVKREHFRIADGTILNSAEAACYLNVHTSTVRRWHAQGLLQGYRIGPRGDRRFRLKELETFLVENSSLFDRELIASSR